MSRLGLGDTPALAAKHRFFEEITKDTRSLLAVNPAGKEREQPGRVRVMAEDIG
jgi:hypothetical protein